MYMELNCTELKEFSRDSFKIYDPFVWQNIINFLYD